MSAFGAKRKARIIQTLDDEDADQGPTVIGVEQSKKDLPVPGQVPLKFARKPFKQSSLRKSINLDDDEETGEGSTSAAAEDEEDSGTPVVIKPSAGRAGSTKQTKRVSSSRLSFGPGEAATGDDSEPRSSFAPRKTLNQRALETGSLKKSEPLSRLPSRALGTDDDRPRYSKEYLDELQSSTPNAPQNLSSLHITDDDDMVLDSAELDGAMIVESSELSRATTTGPLAPTTILTETEIVARKARRARLALEQDAMALDDEEEGTAQEQQYIPLLPRNKKPESRLIAEDEDLGEGYDEFVEDGGLSLGRKAERAAAARHRAEIAALIDEAEGGGGRGGGSDAAALLREDSDSDSSDAERRAAYVAAQTRAAMDGLHRPEGLANGHNQVGPSGEAAIPRMKPLPELAESLARMRAMVQGLQDEATRRRARIAELEREKAEILARETEVQEVLNQAGTKYQAVVASATTSGAGAAGAADVVMLATQSPLRPPLSGAWTGEMPVERGLESFGTTPTTRPNLEELG